MVRQMENDKTVTRKIQYPDLQRLPQTVNQILNNEKMKMVILPDVVTELINDNTVAFEILAPFFDRRAKDRKATVKKYTLRLREEKKARDRKLFFESLTDVQTQKFLTMQAEYNLLFDQGRFLEAETIRRRFSNWLSTDKCYTVFGFKKSRYANNRDSILAKHKAKTKTLQESPRVECNLCSLVLENNNVQKRKHTKYHKNITGDGTVRWRLPL